MEAEGKSGKYEWMTAADLYSRALEKLGERGDPADVTRISGLQAKCYFEGAFQAENREEFLRRMQVSADLYEELSSLYEGSGSGGYSEKAKARALFASSWLRSSGEKRDIILQCVKLGEEAAKHLESGGQKRVHAEALLDLLNYYSEALQFAAEWKSLKELFERGVRVSENAIRELRELNADTPLLESLSKTVEIFTLGWSVIDTEARQSLGKKAVSLKPLIDEVVKRIDTPYTACLHSMAKSSIAGAFEGNPAEQMKLSEAGLSAAEVTRNSLLIGDKLVSISIGAVWSVFMEEEADARREILEKGIKSGARAVKVLEIPLHDYFLVFAYDFYAECCRAIATEVETEAEKKRAYLREAIDIGKRGLIYDKGLTSWSVRHSLSKALYFLATLETDSEAKLRLLREALLFREGSLRHFELVESSFSWDRAVQHNYMALIRAELSRIETDPKKKIALLREAVSDMKLCVDAGANWADLPPFMVALAGYCEWYGDILLQLYHLTSDLDTSRRSIEVYVDAIAYLTKAERHAAVPAVRWKTARVHNTLGDYKEASASFRRAADDYKLAAKNAPGLAATCQELASYMATWAEIEEARLRHNEERYSQAAENYARAADTLQLTRDWKHLSKHYIACSLLEQAEGLSRMERQEESIKTLSKAVETFEEAKSAIKDRVRENPPQRELQELNDWLGIADARAKYCAGILELEEAKALDKKGARGESSPKYRSASRIFHTLLGEAVDEQDRRELTTLMLFCEAWAKMDDAESEGSPELCAAAAETFLKARETADRRFRVLALANASICKALEFGTRFRLTRDPGLYSDIKRQLETATDYYQRAGFQNAADWTRATQRLFDALVYLADAETERETRKKTELYHLAEKHLKLAAKLYDEAGYPSKRDEALKHLKGAQEEKELLLTPLEALSENPAVSGASVMPVSLTRDQALGLERFEAANIVGNLIVSQQELNVGSDVLVELEIANLGKTAATLIKLENIVPEGFQLNRKNLSHRIEDNFISLRGKRLEYLKTDEVKLSLRALQKGKYELRPRVLFVDEKGTYVSYNFPSTELTIGELGISGWIKGAGHAK